MKLPASHPLTLKNGLKIHDTHPNQSVQESGRSIGETFENLLQSVNQQQMEAQAKQTELLTSSKKDIHGTMIALEKADLSLRLMLQVRNKLVEAYQEILRMQV